MFHLDQRKRQVQAIEWLATKAGLTKERENEQSLLTEAEPNRRYVLLR